MNTKDFKLLLMVDEKISKYSCGMICYDSLVLDLEAIWRNFDKVNQDYLEKFTDEWANLEAVRSDVNENGIEALCDKELLIVKSSIYKIHEITKLLLIQDANEVDSSVPEVKALKDNWVMCPFCSEAYEFSLSNRIARCPLCYEKVSII